LLQFSTRQVCVLAIERIPHASKSGVWRYTVFGLHPAFFPNFSLDAKMFVPSLFANAA